MINLNSHVVCVGGWVCGGQKVADASPTVRSLDTAMINVLPFLDFVYVQYLQAESIHIVPVH